MKYASNSNHGELRRRGESSEYFSRYARQEMENDPGNGIQAQITIAQAAYALCAAYAPHLIALLPDLRVAATATTEIYGNAQRARDIGHVAWLYGHAHHCRTSTEAAELAERKLA